VITLTFKILALIELVYFDKVSELSKLRNFSRNFASTTYLLCILDWKSGFATCPILNQMGSAGGLKSLLYFKSVNSRDYRLHKYQHSVLVVAPIPLFKKNAASNVFYCFI